MYFRQVVVYSVAGLLAAAPALDRQSAQQFRVKLSKDERVIHALDRLTFGPKPGDLAEPARAGTHAESAKRAARS